MGDAEATWIAAVGSVVRELRIRQGLSQAQLAAQAGVPGKNTYISVLETGKCGPERAAQLVDRLAPCLGTTREFVESQARLVMAGEAMAPSPVAPAAPEEPAPPATPASSAPAETPPAAVPSAPELTRPSVPTATSSTLDACVDFAEAHLLRVLEGPADELDAVEVHALAAALAHLEEVRDRHRARGD